MGREKEKQKQIVVLEKEEFEAFWQMVEAAGKILRKNEAKKVKGNNEEISH